MLVMKIDKELGTKELIEYAKELSEHLGEKVIILDNKVKDFYRLDEKKIIIPEPLPLYPYNPYPKDYPHWYWTTDSVDATDITSITFDTISTTYTKK